MELSRDSNTASRRTIEHELVKLCTLANEHYSAAVKEFGIEQHPVTQVGYKPTARVVGRFPILYFGDLNAYFDSNSKVKIVTVGLNPSDKEFEKERFSEAEISDVQKYTDGLNSYFRSGSSYWKWFDSYERVLNGMSASYKNDPSFENRVLHTDVCSAVATDPTWSKLSSEEKQFLSCKGIELWKSLIAYLNPDIILMSISPRWLPKELAALQNNSFEIKTFEFRKNQTRRKYPFVVTGYFHELPSGKRSLVVSAPAAQMPFGSLGYKGENNFRRQAGEAIIRLISHRRITGRLVIATHNAGKLAEMRELLAPYNVEAISADELGLPEPEETGTTFAANARIKAAAAAQAANLPAFADDSGLAVDALGGQPGIYSARWAGETKDFNGAMARIERLIQERGATTPGQRKAHFVSALCVAWPDGHFEEVEARVDGTLVWPPRGTAGFGYDPVFLPDGHTRTFGEMTSVEKHGLPPHGLGLSHRAKAFVKLAEMCLS
jgi:XTP/dITP diphosphohydrolase